MTGRNAFPNLLFRIACAAFMVALAIPSWAQSLPNYTNFPMMGLVRSQTLQINVNAIPPDPYFATLGFQDVNGNAHNLECRAAGGAVGVADPEWELADQRGRPARPGAADRDCRCGCTQSVQRLGRNL